MYYYVYWISCKINGKHYIGSKADHNIPEESNYMGSSKLLRKDIKKYGKKNFYKHIVKKFDCEIECRAEEGRLHEFYDVRNNPLFYNESNAGKKGFSNSGKFHHGFGDVDWEGMSMKDPRGYAKIRRVLETELEESKSFSNIWEEEILSPEEVFDRNLEKEYCHKLLSHLSDMDRKIALRIMEGYSSAEISKMYNKCSSWASGRGRWLSLYIRNISRRLGLENLLKEGRQDIYRHIWDLRDSTIVCKNGEYIEYESEKLRSNIVEKT